MVEFSLGVLILFSFIFSFSSSNSLSGSCNVCLRSSPQSLCNNLVSCLILLQEGFRSVDSCAGILLQEGFRSVDSCACITQYNVIMLFMVSHILNYPCLM